MVASLGPAGRDGGPPNVVVIAWRQAVMAAAAAVPAAAAARRRRSSAPVMYAYLLGWMHPPLLVAVLLCMGRRLSRGEVIGSFATIAGAGLLACGAALREARNSPPTDGGGGTRGAAE
eukprot:gene28740-15257_t